jgi:heme/copper-type cytochrome/quinol oxidase subunit 2
MVIENDLNIGEFRLLEVDNKVILPFNSTIRVLIISADVLHA